MRRLMILVVGMLLLAACTAPTPVTPTFAVSGRAVAGPVCPVEPAAGGGPCAPRPVGGAVLVIARADGQEAVRLTTGADGTFTASLPAGSFLLMPQPVAGLLGTAAPIPFDVAPDGPPVELSVEYDTGIR